MKRNVLLFLLLIFITATASIHAFSLYVPGSIAQGGVITVFIEDDDNRIPAELSLGSDDQVFSKSEVFNAEIGGKKVNLSLLGVPSTLSPGIYYVRAKSSDGNDAEAEITVISKDFISENIPLSRSMTTLRKSDDNEKAVQWRNLLVILRRINTDSIYEENNFTIPVEPLRISSFYGDRRTFSYDDGTTARSIHNGIDYSAEIGTPVYAAGRGKVVFSGERILTGNTVVLEHLPGVYSLYYHMNSLMVSENEILSSGEQLGTVGATGLVTGAHLHWEVRVAGVAVAPEPLMSSGIIDKDFILSIIESH